MSAKTRNPGVSGSNTVGNKYPSQKAGLKLNPTSRNPKVVGGGSFSLQSNNPHGDYLQIAQMLQANNYTANAYNNYSSGGKNSKLSHQRGLSGYNPQQSNMMIVGPSVNFHPRSPEKNKFITTASIH